MIRFEPLIYVSEATALPTATQPLPKAHVRVSLPRLGVDRTVVFFIVMTFSVAICWNNQ